MAGALPVSQNPYHVYLASFASAESVRTMDNALRTIAAILGNTPPERVPWWALRYKEAQAIRARLQERYAPATAQKMLSALRGVLKECRRLGYMSGDDYQRTIDLKPVKGKRLPKGRSVTPEEMSAIMQACYRDHRAAGVRDAAMLACMYPGGLRRSEVVALDYRDYRGADDSLTVRSGKGNKDRVVYLANGAKMAMEAWLSWRGDAPGSLLWRLSTNGSLAGNHRITAQSVMLVIQRRCKEAGIELFTPHDLRRTVISDLLDAGVDLAAAQQIAGHSSPDTTSRYDRRGERVKRQAADKLHFPERRR